MTQPVEWINQPHEGYVMNTLFSDENATLLTNLMAKIQETLDDAVFCMPQKSLHITLLDWIAPLVNYEGSNKTALFEQIYEKYDEALTEITTAQEPIEVTFDQIHLSPTTLYISGHDNGQFEDIRSTYLEKVELLPGTKLPPKIIHSSLARFTKAIDMSLITSFIESQSISFNQTVAAFQLVHTTKEPMLEFEVLKTYQLG